MKRWVKPRTEVQVFEANEYVAACYSVFVMLMRQMRYEKAWRRRPWWAGGDLSNERWTHCATACGAPGLLCDR